jgi:hypothetical protein
MTSAAKCRIHDPHEPIAHSDGSGGDLLRCLLTGFGNRGRHARKGDVMACLGGISGKLVEAGGNLAGCHFRTLTQPVGRSNQIRASYKQLTEF